MVTKYYALLTNIGAAKLANATALGEQVEITQMAVGDGNGVLPTPNPAQTALVHEMRRAPLNTLTIDPVNTNQIIAEQVIPEDVGGWWIREIGLYDSKGDLIAIANCAETYKPLLQEGSGRVQVIRVILIVSSTQAVTLKIDPSVVLATRQYVDDQIIQVKAYVDQQLAAHVAAADPHKQYAPKASPVLTGKPTTPTAADKDNSTQIASTAFVQAALAALVGSSPEALDTLNELAAALGNDPNFATTVMNELAGKMAIAKNGSDIANVGMFLQNLGLQAFNTTAEYSSVSAPTGGVFFYITSSGAWGVQDSVGNPLPLAIANGGTNANTLLGARVELGIAAFGGDGQITTVSSPGGKVYFYIDDNGHWGVQDYAGNPLPLALATGGTGANTLLGARVQLNIEAFGSDNDRTTMSSPGATAFIFIDKNGDWGVLDASGRTIGLPVSRGGTGATDAAGARTALELGTAATKNVGTQSGQIPDMSAFQYSATAKGYERMPNGMLRQWGTISIPAANDSTNATLDSFLIPFPNGVLSCKVNGTDTLTNTPCFATAEAASKTQIRLKAVAIDLQNKTITQGMAVNVAWEAIGA